MGIQEQVAVSMGAFVVLREVIILEDSQLVGLKWTWERKSLAMEGMQVKKKLLWEWWSAWGMEISCDCSYVQGLNGRTIYGLYRLLSMVWKIYAVILLDKLRRVIEGLNDDKQEISDQ